jgi:hypothetical protein
LWIVLEEGEVVLVFQLALLLRINGALRLSLLVEWRADLLLIDSICQFRIVKVVYQVSLRNTRGSKTASSLLPLLGDCVAVGKGGVLENKDVADVVDVLDNLRSRLPVLYSEGSIGGVVKANAVLQAFIGSFRKVAIRWLFAW